MLRFSSLTELIHPKKSLGQHWLTDSSYCLRTVQFAGIKSGDRIIEIGAGTGLLTRHLLETGAHVTAIEFDRDLIEGLEILSSLYPGRVEVVPANVLRVDWDELISSTPVKVVGNLPYNISTRIIREMIGIKKKFHSFTLMVQKEVASRILAAPGTSDYGYFSVLMAYHFDSAPGFDVPPGAFRPPPKVTSHVMRLSPQSQPLQVPDEGDFDRLLKMSFRHRRKTLANNLKALIGKARLKKAFEDCSIPAGSRPQELAPEDYVCLARVL